MCNAGPRRPLGQEKGESTQNPTSNRAFITPKTAHVKLTATCLVLLSLCLAWTFSESSVVAFSHPFSTFNPPIPRESISIQQKRHILDRCAAIRTIPGPPSDFLGREESDRFEPGTNATLIRNASIFTGLNNGTDVLRGDILLDGGIIKAIGEIPGGVLKGIENLTTVDANGAWVTPGLGTPASCNLVFRISFADI